MARVEEDVVTLDRSTYRDDPPFTAKPAEACGSISSTTGLCQTSSTATTIDGDTTLSEVTDRSVDCHQSDGRVHLAV